MKVLEQVKHYFHKVAESHGPRASEEENHKPQEKPKKQDRTTAKGKKSKPRS